MTHGQGTDKAESGSAQDAGGDSESYPGPDLDDLVAAAVDLRYQAATQRKWSDFEDGVTEIEAAREQSKDGPDDPLVSLAHGVTPWKHREGEVAAMMRGVAASSADVLQATAFDPANRAMAAGDFGSGSRTSHGKEVRYFRSIAEHVLARNSSIGESSAGAANASDAAERLFGSDDRGALALSQLGAALAVPSVIAHCRGINALQRDADDPSPPPWLQPLSALSHFREGDSSRSRNDARRLAAFLQDERTFVDRGYLSKSQKRTKNVERREGGSREGGTEGEGGEGEGEGGGGGEEEVWQSGGITVSEHQRGLQADCSPLMPGTRYRFRVRFQIICDAHTVAMARVAEPSLTTGACAAQSSLNKWQPWEAAVASAWVRLPGSRPRRPPPPLVLVVAPSAIRVTGVPARTNGAGVIAFEFRIRRVRGVPTRRVLEASDSGSDAAETKPKAPARGQSQAEPRDRGHHHQ